MLDLQVVHLYPQAEMPFELEQQLHHPDGVEPPRRQEIGLGPRHVDVKISGEDRRDFGEYRRGSGRRSHEAATVSGANVSFSRRRSILPLLVLGSSGSTSQRDGSMYAGSARPSASRNPVGVTSAPSPGT